MARTPRDLGSPVRRSPGALPTGLPLQRTLQWLAAPAFSPSGATRRNRPPGTSCGTVAFWSTSRAASSQTWAPGCRTPQSSFDAVPVRALRPLL